MYRPAVEDDRGESKRQIERRKQRRMGDRSAALARTLMMLSDAVIAKLELEDELKEMVDRARGTKTLGARRRAERALAGDLRGEDLGALEQRLAAVETTGAAAPALLKLAEQWRTRLIAEGIAAAAEFPGGATDQLTRAIQDARRERDTGKPPGAARALFRQVVTVLKAQAPAPKPESEE